MEETPEPINQEEIDAADLKADELLEFLASETDNGI